MKSLKLSNLKLFWALHGGTVTASITLLFLITSIFLLLIGQSEANKTRAILSQRVKQAETDLAILRNDNVLMLRYYNCTLLAGKPITLDTVQRCTERALAPTELTKDSDNLLFRSSIQGLTGQPIESVEQ